MSTWNQTTIAGHQVDLFEPNCRNEYGYVVLYLHGVHRNRLSDQPRFTDLFERFCLPVIAPMTGPCWWTDKICPKFDPVITPERHVLEDVLPYLAHDWSAKPPQIALLGTSMGGQGALRLAYKHPTTFPVVAAIAPTIDYHLRFQEDQILQAMYTDQEAVRQDTATLHIHPLNWPRHQFFCCDPTDERWWDGADRLRMKLYSLGIPHECDLETSGGGHGFEYYNSMAERALKFLLDRLDQERHRVA